MTDPLHVITFHANPMGWASRTRLASQFAASMAELPVSFHVVEVDYAHRNWQFFGPGVLQLRASDMMWHKENALNLLVRQLPQGWNYIAWIDADLSFLRSDWPARAIEALQKRAVIQLFDQAFYLDPTGKPMGPPVRGVVASSRHTRRHTAQGWQESITISGHPGFAWAMTRQAYEHLGGFGDWGITGSGDWHMAAAFLGQVRRGRADMTLAVVAKWEGFQRRAADLGPPGFIPDTIYHHWHGPLAARQYNSRHQILRQANPPYDPDLDIEPDPSTGLYRFTPAGERLREPLRQYFSSRNEDSVEV